MIALDTNIAVAINNGQPRAVAWVLTQPVVYLPTPVLNKLARSRAGRPVEAPDMHPGLHRARCLIAHGYLGELVYGAANSKNVVANRQRVVRLRSACQLLDVDEGVAERYADVRFGLKAVGRPIPENDIWIAAVCLTHAIPLATADVHFGYVAGLTVVTV